MNKKIIYNPDSTETLNERRIINGNPDGMLNFTAAKYKWATKLWDMMEGNTWFPKEVQMSLDARDYKLLPENEKRMYDLILSQLIFMDSLQTNNVMDNINPYITAPEVNACLSRLSYEEANHSKSYAVMVESISENTDEIYNYWKKDARLRAKNDYIAKAYSDLSEGEMDDTKILLAMFANQILEGVYFYSGFMYMYSLARSGKMLNSAAMIRFIQRDEVTHLLLFQNMINETRKENPHLFTPELEAKVREMFRGALELEVDWGMYISNGELYGITEESLREYIESIVDERLNAVGYERMYNTRNPFVWVKNFADIKNLKTNPFEGSVGNYSKGSLDTDDF